MKIPITDQFLIDFYDFLQPSINIADILFTPRTIHLLRYEIFNERSAIFRKYQNELNRRKFTKLISYLKKRNYIKVKNLQGKQAIMLTQKGINKAIMNYFKKDITKFNKRKDGKWIMIIFDIPQKHNKARGLLRSILKNLGYKMFQQSVWVTPYDVSEKTEELLQWYSLDEYVKIFLVEDI